MSWVTIAAIYFTLWWIVLFAVLPFGVRPEEKPELGHAESAPKSPMLLKKFFWTSIVTAVLMAVVIGLFESGLLDYGAIVSDRHGGY